MTQKERVLDYIDRFGSITQKEAFEDLGCMRLAARIADIEADGIAIDRTMEKSRNRFGEAVSYMRYRRAEKC